MRAFRFPRRVSALSVAVLFSSTAFALAQSYHVLEAYQTGGEHPKAALIETADGFYGTTYQGGTAGKGTIFRISSDGTLTTLHAFTGPDGAYPEASLLEGTDGNLYGTTSSGSIGPGTVFRMAPDGTGFTTLYTFHTADGSTPRAALIQGSDGNLYGTTHEGGAHFSGTVFKIDTTTLELTTLHDFVLADGGYPLAGLIQAADGNLYGAVSEGGANGVGAIFRIDTGGVMLTTLHDFDGDDGASPAGTLVQDADGMLYGTTGGGGAIGQGTVFKIDTAGSMLVTLHSFVPMDGEGPHAGLILGSDGKLYGTARVAGGSDRGTVFRLATGGTGFEVVHSFSAGAYPWAALLEASDGKLYGTTEDTGNLPSQYGTIFRLEPDGSAFETIYTFEPFREGKSPRGEPIPSSLNPGTVYGTTSEGGEHNFGTIFRIGSDGSAFIVLHSFTYTDGARPYARLLEGPDGVFYGTTFSGGGGNGRGTVFKLDPAGPTLTTLHIFTGTGDDGANPGSGVILGADGFLYGTTESGGTNANFGTVFRIGTDGNDYSTVHSFDGSDGQLVLGAVMQAADGRLYGTTDLGGAHNAGTIYRVDAGGSNFVTLHDFDSTDGANSYAGLVQAPDGYLYGTTYVGGANGVGTVFKIDTGGALLTTIHTFSTTDGAGPTAALVLAADGYFYGTTNVGGVPSSCASGCGTVFRVDNEGHGFATVHVFSPDEGAGPIAGVVQGPDGNLYGAALFGGAADGGVVFRLDLCYLASPPPMAVDRCLPSSTPGLMASVPGKSGAAYDWVLDEGTIDAGQGTSSISFTSGAPGTRMKLSVIETDASGCVGSSVDALQVDYGDVPPADPFYSFVCTIGRDGITAGCGGGDYCRDGAVTRAQMAVFLLKAEHSSSYVPPSCVGVFSDVACPGLFTDWIEQLAAEGITAGCGGGKYCPDDAVTRAQMSAFLLKAEHGTAYVPPACGSLFTDVTCPSLFADWIEQLAAEGVTAGCGGGKYCPASPSSRGQMAVFLVKTFQLM